MQNDIDDLVAFCYRNGISYLHTGLTMNAKDYIEEFGADKATELAVAAGTNYAYFYQIAIGHRRPSVDLANALVKKSKGKLDFVKLMNCRKKKKVA